MAQPPPDKRERKDSPPAKAAPRGSTGERPGLRDITGETALPRRTNSGLVPAPKGPPKRTASTGVAAIDLGGSRNPMEFQKHILNSTFSDRATFPGDTGRGPADDDESPTKVGHVFDGNTPAPGVTAKEPWKAITAPVQSREGRRSVELYTAVLDQFAVGVNPRYETDAPDKPRGHIFLWDVTRALNVEVPHFAGTRELSLGQTCLWIRDQGPLRGWYLVEIMRAMEAVEAGMPVVVIPKDPRNNLLGLMRPGELAKDRKPFLSAAAKKRGNNLTVQEAFGVHAVQYYFHA
jgi:hypothetical protein